MGRKSSRNKRRRHQRAPQPPRPSGLVSAVAEPEVEAPVPGVAEPEVEGVGSTSGGGDYGAYTRPAALVGEISTEQAAIVRGLLDERTVEFFNGLDIDRKRALTRGLGWHVEPRYLRGGFGRRLVERCHAMSLDRFCECNIALFREAHKVIDRDPVAAATIQNSNRTDDEVAALVAAAVDATSPALAASWVFVAAQVLHDDRFVREVENLIPLGIEPAGEQPAGGVEAAGEQPAGGVEATGEQPAGGVEATGVPGATVVEADVTDVESFSPLDQMLIREALATSAESVGCATPEEMAAVIDEVIRMNPSRRISWFHAGFVEVLCGSVVDPPPQILNDERRGWLTYGRLSAFVRHGDGRALCAEVTKLGERAVEVVAHESHGRVLAAALISAELEFGDDVVATRLLEVAPPNATDMAAAFGDTYRRARELAAVRDPLAVRMYAALERFAAAVVGFEAPDGEYLSSADVLADLSRRQSSALRGLRRFADARECLDAAPEPGAAEFSALLSCERGLIDSEIMLLTDLSWGEAIEVNTEQTERLRRGSTAFIEALDADPSQHRAALPLGLLTLGEGDTGRAAELFGVAERGFARGGTAIATRMGLLAGALRAALLLSSDGGTPNVCCDAIIGALNGGVRLPTSMLNDAIETLALRDVRAAARFFIEANRLRLPLSALQPALLATISLCEDGDIIGDLVEVAILDGNLSDEDRVTVYLAAIHASLNDPDRAGLLFDQADDLVAAAGNPAVDDWWVSKLVGDEPLAKLVGDQIHYLWMEQLVRKGDMQGAIALAVGRFHPACRRNPHEAIDLLELLVEYGCDEDELEKLRRRLPGDEGVSEQTEKLTKAIRVAFVGAGDVQAAHQRELDTEIEERWGGLVTVEWTFSGWDANWTRYAEQVESGYRSTDILVLSNFMRTNLGRRLRRTCGEAGLPWASCYGRGHGAVLRSVAGAVEVVAAVRGSGRVVPG